MPTMPMKNPHAVALGKLGGAKGGRARSAAKTEAARRNAKLGGRPKSLERRAAEAAASAHRLTPRQTQRIVDMLMDRSTAVEELQQALATARKFIKAFKD